MTIEEKLEVAVKALEWLDWWQGTQHCNASVYEIEDDDFGMMQFKLHEALALISNQDMETRDSDYKVAIENTIVRLDCRRWAL